MTHLTKSPNSAGIQHTANQPGTGAPARAVRGLARARLHPQGDSILTQGNADPVGPLWALFNVSQRNLALAAITERKQEKPI